MSESIVSHCFQDDISNIQFSPQPSSFNTSDFLLASSWDKTIELIEINNNETVENSPKHIYTFTSPILQTAFGSNNTIGK